MVENDQVRPLRERKGIVDASELDLVDARRLLSVTNAKLQEVEKVAETVREGMKRFISEKRPLQERDRET
jgi:hypothetical protein